MADAARTREIEQHIDRSTGAGVGVNIEVLNVSVPQAENPEEQAEMIADELSRRLETVR